MRRAYAAVLLACALVSVSAPWIPLYPFDLLSNFQAQWIGVHAALALGAAALVSPRWLLVPAAAIGAHALLLAPLYVAPAGKAAGVPVRVLWINVRDSNRHVDRVLSVIQQTRADVVALGEFDRRWPFALPERLRGYPFLKFTVRPRDGIALFSRHPIVSARYRYFGRRRVPSIEAVLNVRGRRVTVIATHPLSPRTPERFEARNAELGDLAQEPEKGPLILVGDLNTSLWSSYFRRLRRGLRAHNVRDGFGILPTWPVKWRLLRIPLDHGLVSGGVSVTNVRVGPDVGSDHYPLIIDAVIPNAAARAPARR